MQFLTQFGNTTINATVQNTVQLEVRKSLSMLKELINLNKKNCN